MALYKYKAKDKEGKTYERTIEVKNRLDIYNVIREEGGRMAFIRVVGNQSVLLFWDRIFSNISTHQKITFAKNLGLMMRASLPLARALYVMSKQSKSKPFKKLLDR